MPKSTQHALITWIPGSEDGAREARRLHARFRDYSVLVKPGSLTPTGMDNFMSTIVVGHRGELGGQPFASLCQLVAQSSCSWVVLAICDGSVAKRTGTLGDNELISPAQALANSTGKKVSSTTRPLLFTEVGEGLAFALTMGEILIRSNYHGVGEGLWVDLEKQGEVEELAGMIDKL